MGERTKVAVVLGDPRLPYSYAKDNCFGEEEFKAVEVLQSALARLPDYEFVYLDDHEQLIDQLRGEHFDLALNLCDTGYRNEWLLERNVPAFLEMLGIPYTGADPMAISLGTDKAIMRALGVSMGIPVPNEIYVDLTADPPLLPTVYPALVKPNSSGGSFGVTEQCVVNDPAEAEAYMRWLAPQLEPPEALIQDFLTGDEYTLGLIGNPSDGFTVLPPLAIDYSGLDPDLPPVLTYGSKADPESPYWNKISFRQAQLDEVTWSQMVDHATKIFRRLGFRDYARIDFRCGADGQPRLLEANTNPTWYWDGKLALMAQWAGYDYHQMLELIMQAAQRRYGLMA